MLLSMNATLRNILIFLGILLLLACAWYFRSIVVYILVSGVFSIMGRPLVDLFCRIHIKKVVISESFECSGNPSHYLGVDNIVFLYFHTAGDHPA